jgi:PiT family inorganic phosphate transporter
MTVETLLLWLALIAGFYMAWNIGANDVANAFGTSVGSGALTFGKAIVLAAIFEFAGAFLVGSHVADTIKGNIVQPSVFADQPRLFVYGMMSALTGAAIWLHLATHLGKPVSTTHSIIGGVIGFGLIAAGTDSIQWHKMGRIASSWIVSPVAGALLAFLLYRAVRKYVLRSDEPVRSARAFMPIGLSMVFFVITFSICKDLLPRAAKGTWYGEHWAITAIVMAIVIGGVTTLLTRFALSRRPMLPIASTEEGYARVEMWFGRLQVVTACFMAFAHGANDVANAIGPIAGILQALKGGIAAKTAVPMWVLAFGGLGIVVGLAMYGRKVMEEVGKNITEVTPTRGFSAEFGTATTVLACSLLGLPISTTFVLVGAVMGVGFARGFAAIDLGVVRKIFLSWVITIPISAILSAATFLLLRHFLGG